MGIEPTSETWQAPMPPLYDPRSGPYATNLPGAPPSAAKGGEIQFEQFGSFTDGLVAPKQAAEKGGTPSF